LALNATIDYLFENFGWRSSLSIWRNQFEEFASAIAKKGSPLDNVIGFIDGTPRAICRPSEGQKYFYSGHKPTHCLKFQSIMLPSGIVGIMDGPYVGSRHDAGMIRISGFDRKLQTELINNNRQYILYGDPGYPTRQYLECPYKGSYLTPMQEEFNSRMSGVRIVVEWGFSKIIALFAFLDFKKNLKILLQDVGKYYLVGTLFTNIHTILNGSQTTAFFQLENELPSLEDYLTKEQSLDDE